MKNLFTGLDSPHPIGTISGDIEAEHSKFFAADLRQISSRGITPKININSPGGSVFGGMEIIDAMIDSNVDTHIMGMAFSMGGIISQFGKKRTANDFSMLMIHAVSGAGNKNLEEKLNTSLKNILMSRSNMTQKMLDDIFEKKKDAFFDSSQMLELGLIDEIVSTKVKVTNLANSLELSNLYEIFNTAVNELQNSDQTLTSTVKSLNVKKMDEYKEVKGYLHLDSTDTEKSVLNSIKGKDVEISDLKTEIELKDEEIDGLKNQVTSANEQKAVDLVNKAKEDGKINEDSVKHFTAFAKSDYDSCKAAIDGISTTPNSLMNAVDKSTPTGDASLIERGYKDIAENDPELLTEIAEDKPELFNKLQDAYNKLK